MIVSLVFEGEHIRRGIEVVITGLTRNQFARKRTRVRIPSSPPNNQPDSGITGIRLIVCVDFTEKQTSKIPFKTQIITLFLSL